MAKPSFPYRTSDNKAVEQAQQVLRARYYRTIDEAARRILKSAADSFEPDDAGLEDYVYAQVADYIEESGLIRPAANALNTLQQSEAWREVDSAVDEGLVDLPGNEIQETLRIAAYYAVLHDLVQKIDGLSEEYGLG